jgi:endoglucanase
MPDPFMNKDISSLDFISRFSAGWSLGNAFDYCDFPVTQKFFDLIKKTGFDIVRVPVTWCNHIGSPSGGYKIAESFISSVARAVRLAHNAGLAVILNLHHDGADTGGWISMKEAAESDVKNCIITKKIAAVWMQIAAYFRNEGDYLIFETLNEIHDGKWGWGGNRSDGGRQYAILNEWNQTAVNAIRGTEGNNSYRYIAVPGYVSNPELTMKFLSMPEDPSPSSAQRMIVTVHFYDPYTFSINAQDPVWGYEAGAPGVKDTWQESCIRAVFSQLQDIYVKNGYAVYIGECGAVFNKGYEVFREYYIEYVMRCAKENRLLPVYWDNGVSGSGKECFGLFDRSRACVCAPEVNDAQNVIKSIMRAVKTEDTAYTLASITERYRKLMTPGS